MSTVHLNYVVLWFDNSVSPKVVEEAWRENYNSSQNSKKFDLVISPNKAVRLTLVVFCVLPLLWHIARNKAKYFALKVDKEPQIVRREYKHATKVAVNWLLRMLY